MNNIFQNHRIKKVANFTMNRFTATKYTLSCALLASCVYNDFQKTVDCSKSDLSIKVVTKLDPSLCKAIDGAVTVLAEGGDGPYNFSLDGKSFQTSNQFSHLGPGTYTVMVEDIHGCQNSVQETLAAPQSSLAASAVVSSDTECLSDNGSITVNVSKGVTPYQFQFGTGLFGSTSTFSNLKSGVYTVTVKDASDCPLSLSVVVPRSSTGVSYSNEIKSILDTNCNISGCHNGDLGGNIDWQVYNNLKANAQNIKTRTANRSMPIGGRSLTQAQIDLIACWVDDGANNN